MDYQQLPQQALDQTPDPAWAATESGLGAGLLDQDLFGNGFLASQLGESVSAAPSMFSFFGLFGDEVEAPRAKKGIGEAARTLADRAAAAEELKAKFHVGEGSEEGKAGVSEEEYARIVALYSDIRMGKTQLKLDTSGLDEDAAKAFRDGTMGDLSTMMQTESGRQLLDELAHGNKGHQTTIGATKGDPDTGAWLPGLDMGDVDDRWKLHHALHDGSGANSSVSYQPGQTVHTKHDGDIRSDIVLYHELTHAWHNGNGQNAQGAVSGADGVSVGYEEFEAAGMGPWSDARFSENRYRGERDRMGDKVGPRKTYGGTTPQEHGL